MIENLKKQNQVYPCTCSRKNLKAKATAGELSTGPLGVIYPGLCTDNIFSSFKPEHYSIRIKVPEQNISFDDEIIGSNTQNLKTESGDFIIRRRDGLFAYQLAVVVDDAFQNITHVVRGADLLDSTARQLYLQQRLKYPQLQYAHLPLMVHTNGDKLSKQTGAKDIGDKADIPLLVECLEFLGQNPPEYLTQASLTEFWQWAQCNWQLTLVITSEAD